MYVKRIQLINYGPIENLDINLPFDGDLPKPVLLVGKNGSGKSIVVSHIVNAMITARDTVYPESSEVDAGKVYKLRSSSYIYKDAEYYFSRVDFESGLYVQEMRLRRKKFSYSEPPIRANSPAMNVWETILAGENLDCFDTSAKAHPIGENTPISKLLSSNCLLYFPSNRMEEPAWLNEANLRAKPQYTDGTRIRGETQRRVIAHSPLRDIHNWLYSVAYDRAAFEINSQSLNIAVNSESEQSEPATVPLPLFLGYQGDATNMYNAVLAILQAILTQLPINSGVRFGIGGRLNRVLTVESASGTVVPNVFQLSSGEMALFTLFVSILKDFDLCTDLNLSFTSTNDVRGLVVVDEVDLHLHATHQHDVLPQLIRMFPKVQFVMTTHSPLLTLGMEKAFGENGFEVYDLPTGSPVISEEFSEFGEALEAFKTTSKFLDEVHTRVAQSQEPLLYVEGATDKKYLSRAAHFLCKSDILDRFAVELAEGEGYLKTIWKALRRIPKSVAKPIVLLHDPESNIQIEGENSLYKRKMPFLKENPIEKGIENLFSHETIQRARESNAAFIDIEPKHIKTKRGKPVIVAESWTVNEDEKTNLCNWICRHGTSEDFRHFKDVFEILELVIQELEMSAPDEQSDAGT